MGNSVKQTKETLVTSDIYKDFLREIHQYPILSSEETLYLVDEAQYGNEQALDKLVKHNLRLIAAVAREYQYRISSFQMMDLIQEGTLGFITAIKKYDKEKGRLSTYGVIWIKQAIERALENKEDSIRKTVNFTADKNKYLKFIQEYINAGIELPDDETICDILGITLNRLKLIRLSDNLNPISMSSKVTYDDDTEISDFISDNNDDFADIVEDIDTHRLLVVLKQILNPVQYFIIYHHILFKDGTTFNDVCKYLGITTKRAVKIEKIALSKVKPYMEMNSPLFNRTLKSLIEQNIKIENINIKPIDPLLVIKYTYAKKWLTELESQLMFLFFFDEFKYSDNMASRRLNLSVSELRELKIALQEKLKSIFADTKQFNEYAKNMVKVYGTKILDLVRVKLLETKNDLPVSFEQILAHSQNLEDSEIDLLRRFYGITESVGYSDYEIEKDVYLTIFGVKNKEASISVIKLYETFLKHRDQFDDEQALFLECKLSRKTLAAFLNKYPKSKLPKNHKFLIRKLEILYYNIGQIFDKEFTKTQYLFVLANYPNKISERRQQLLKLYYGVECEALSINEIADSLNEEYNKIRSEVFSALDFLKNLYYGISKENNIDYDKYMPYVLSKKYEFTDETRKVLKLLLIDCASYEEIAITLGLERSRVTNLVNDGLRRIDFYRFGLICPNNIEESDLQKYFNSDYCSLSILEKSVVYAKKCDMRSYENIIEEHNITKAKYDRIITKFNEEYNEYLARGVMLAEDDIKEEINKPLFDSVISVEDKKILSYLYGFINRYNIGSKLKKTVLSKILNFSESTIQDKSKKALNRIKLRKLGLIKPDLLYIEREKLDEILEDKHLPISPEEREMICYMFALKDYPLKTLEDISKILNMPLNHLKRRYQRAIVTIFKYINHEIEGILDYNEDVLPKLPFFSKRDAALIIDHYEACLTNQEISQKYNISIHTVNRMVRKIKILLSQMVKNPMEQYFDFEKYRMIVNDPSLPYYGNLSLAKKCFELYTGESTMNNLSIPDIIRELNLTCSAETVRNHITLFMLSIYKFQRGIKKQTTISDEDIREYYTKNQDCMSVHRLACFNRYLSGSVSRSEFTDDTEFVSDTVIFDLLKEKNPLLFDLENVTREEAWVLLKRYYNGLNEGIRNALITKFNLQERDFMIELEKEKAFSLIRKLQSKAE